MTQDAQPTPKRIKTPTVLQMEATECGAASLAIVLGYYGCIVPLEVLREACGVSRDGSKAINIVKAARSYGLITKAYKMEPDSLRSLPLPQIVFWNFNHFLVVEGFKGDRVYLNDPATGPRTVTFEEFDESFTGVVITFEPGPEFVKSGAYPSLFASLQRRLAGSQTALIYIILAGLGLVIPGLLVPAFLRVFVDNILIERLDGWLGPLLLGMGLTLLITAALTWLREFYLLRLETKLALNMSSQFFWHILQLPVVFFSQRFAGEIGSRVAINDRIARLLSGELATTVVNMITVLFFLVVMAWYDWILTFIGVVIVLLNILALRLVSRRRIDGNRRMLNEMGKLVGTSMGGLQTIETIKASGAEGDFFSRWAGYQAKVINAQQELFTYTDLLTVVPPFLTTINTIAILTVGGYRVMAGEMTIGTLVAFQSLMLSFVTPFNRLVEMGSILQEVEGDMNRIDDVLNYEIDPLFRNPAVAATAFSATKLTGAVELRNLTFGYSHLDPPLIENFSLTITPGSRVALVGSTGSGKSTVARLVQGLYEPWSGTILFDGIPRTEMPRDLLTNSLAVVDQDIFLFEGTVHENLTLWDETIAEATILRGAKDAVIHEVIAARAGGYYSMVAENGRNFSGGERQRLEIARALVGEPTVLILDEATSALDPALEQMIDENVRRRGCTTLIIAHRLSTIRDCDEIIVLEQGKVAQRGTHDEMIHSDGPYARLIQTDALKSEKSRTQSLLESLF